MPTRAWNEADPANADDASLGAQEIRELKVDVRERMSLEHLFATLIGSTEAGMHIWDYKTKTISYQLAVTDHFVFATQGTTMTLPAIAAANKGKAFAIKVNGTGTVTIARTGTDTIDGATTLAITGTALGGEVAYLVSDGVSDWKRYITYKPDESAGVALTGYKNLVVQTVVDHVSVDIDADEVVMSNSSGQTKRALAVNLTVDLDVSAAINGRDAGSVAASQQWYLYVISDGTTVAGLASQSATAPTLPAGYTYKCLVGWCTTDDTASPFNIEKYVQRNHIYILTNLSSAPTHSAERGTIWVTSTGDAYLNVDSSTTWKPLRGVSTVTGYAENTGSIYDSADRIHIATVLSSPTIGGMVSGAHYSVSGVKKSVTGGGDVVVDLRDSLNSKLTLTLALPAGLWTIWASAHYHNGDMGDNSFEGNLIAIAIQQEA